MKGYPAANYYWKHHTHRPTWKRFSWSFKHCSGNYISLTIAHVEKDSMKGFLILCILHRFKKISSILFAKIPDWASRSSFLYASQLFSIRLHCNVVLGRNFMYTHWQMAWFQQYWTCQPLTCTWLGCEWK
jgi:hypothetical protein